MQECGKNKRTTVFLFRVLSSREALRRMQTSISYECLLGETCGGEERENEWDEKSICCSIATDL